MVLLCGCEKTGIREEKVYGESGVEREVQVK